MPTNSTTANTDGFGLLLDNVRRGCPEAISELVTTYEPEIRIAVRALLNRSTLRSQFDSVDIVQSVLLRFCLRLGEADWEFDSPDQLVALLKKIAYHRFLNKVEYARADARDQRRLEGADRLVDLDGGQPSPQTVLGWKEEYLEIQRRLTDEEHRLASQRAEGATWAEIAGDDPSAQDRLRHQLTAAWKRVAQQLGRLRSERVTVEYVQAIFQWFLEQTSPEET